MRAIRNFLTLAILTALIVQNANAQSTDSKPGAIKGAGIFPADTSLFLQVSNPSQLIDEILEHPLREKIESLPDVKELLQNPQLAQGRIGLKFLEARIGEEWLPAVKKLTEGGLFVGADPKSQSVGIIFQSSDEALLKKTASEILGFVKNQAGEDAFEVESYRDGKVADLDQLVVGRFGDWFIMSNQKRYAKKMADNLLDGVQKGTSLASSLAANNYFEKALSAVADTGDLFAFADLNVLRDVVATSDDAFPLFAGDTDNPGVELLFGGILESLQDADYATASLDLGEDAISISATVPFEAATHRKSREFYFGNQGLGRAPAPIDVPDLLGCLTSYRDLGRWWLNKEDLFPENVIAELALADSQFSTFFGGADFGEEILGALQPGLQFVAKAQSYEEGNEPQIKIPSFALVSRLQNPKRDQRFRVSFNSFITLLNLNQESNMPQFDIVTMNEGNYKITSATYLAEDVGEDRMYTNFSPSIAFQDDYMIISSTEEFAHELAEATTRIGEDRQTESNTLLTLNGSTIRDILRANRESLVASQMVESGKSRPETESDIDLLLSVLDYIKGAELDYRIEPHQMVMDMQISFDAD